MWHLVESKKRNFVDRILQFTIVALDRGRRQTAAATDRDGRRRDWRGGDRRPGRANAVQTAQRRRCRVGDGVGEKGVVDDGPSSSHGLQRRRRRRLRRRGRVNGLNGRRGGSNDWRRAGRIVVVARPPGQFRRAPERR